MGRFSRTMPEPCQPFLNASLASETGMLAPPPNPIWNGFTGSGDAMAAAGRKHRSRSDEKAHDRMMGLLRVRERRIVRVWFERSAQGSEATADAQARPTWGADGC